MTEEDKEKIKDAFNTKPITAHEVHEMIIDSPKKMNLILLFNSLMQENSNLKKQLEEIKNNGKA